MFTIKFQLTNFKSKLLFRHGTGWKRTQKALKQKRAESSQRKQNKQLIFLERKSFSRDFYQQLSTATGFQLEKSQIIYGYDFVFSVEVFVL